MRAADVPKHNSLTRGHSDLEEHMDDTKGITLSKSDADSKTEVAHSEVVDSVKGSVSSSQAALIDPAKSAVTPPHAAALAVVVTEEPV